MTIPVFGLGTFHLKDGVVIAFVKTVFGPGYRTVGITQIYDSEAAIGQTAVGSDIPRSELYITTKIWIEGPNKEKLVPSLRESLRKLHTDYVDLALIHRSSPGDAASARKFIQVLPETKQQGPTRETGISNFIIPLMEKATATVDAESTATNQIELSPYLQGRKVVDWARTQSIHITSCITLVYGKTLKDKVITYIAAKHNATPTQVVLVWTMGEGYSVIPFSIKHENLASNLLALESRLNAKDKKAIAALDYNDHLVSPEGPAPDQG